MPQTLTADNVNLQTEVASTFNRANKLSLILDADVSGAATRANLKARIAAKAVHADAENFKTHIYRAINVSGLSDSDVNGVSTFAGLLALIPVVPTSQAVLD